MPIQQALRPFDGTDPTYTTEDFLNAITAKMVMTAGPEQIFIISRSMDAQTNRHDTNGSNWSRTKMVLTHSIGKIKKNWQAFSRKFQKTFDNQQSQTQAKLL